MQHWEAALETWGDAPETRADRARLRERIGERFTLRGRLVRCDPFMRNLFVADGELTGN